MSSRNTATKTRRPPTCLGIDLARRSVHVHGVDGSGKTCLDRKMTIRRLRAYLGSLPPCKVAVEACGRAHHWARECIRMGHDARLIAPQFVRPYVVGNRNDRADAAAICEAAQCSSMRLVGIRSEESQSHPALHRARSMAVAERTALGNRMRGLPAGSGIGTARGRSHIAPVVQAVPGDGGTDTVSLPPMFLDTLRGLYEEPVHGDRRIENFNRRIRAIAGEDERARLLMTIPGFGPVTATALAATVGDPGVFGNGREMAAWLGLVPRQSSTGGRAKLPGVGKRGDACLRTLPVRGARHQRTLPHGGSHGLTAANRENPLPPEGHLPTRVAKTLTVMAEKVTLPA